MMPATGFSRAMAANLRAPAAEPRPGAARGRAGFTLVEVLLVMALLALFAAVFIPGVTSILREIDSRGPEQLLAESILAARSEALESDRMVELRYDDQTRQLVWGATATRGEAMPLGTSCDLLPVATGGNVLLGGVLEEAGNPLRRVRFFPDGTCDAFRVRLKTLGQTPRLYLIDPWTCAASPVGTKG
ncbi:MAG: prepilin-type N-terminal cleavage/methylation domain-containing protein [Candidatus Didemnitutus sp.]|nr:prepilin-type N-terminal cleavage/methylation domain-containing protein [Candidatus Didemnitutus sp.]